MTYKQAAQSPQWISTMTEEILALKQKGTWSLVPPPTNDPILGCKWTFKIKTLPNGSIDLYKARLVAQGFNHTQGDNYNETFSPVTKMTTIRMLLTLALHRNWSTLQLKVSNAFLHGDLIEKIYMHQPPGFIDP
ncbi:uncharacterized protein LOC110102068 [Dendrobium catenatum]|uniref:uncharacterized protein LOC110102068 n=1 Tax=Dendrobium catenatum TaxID=906689 RepID=UPI0009F71295|nr:uncharacterized protein LOC110102068 [Dendrobium catenatum]